MQLSIMYATCYTFKGLWQPFLKLKEKYIDTSITTYFCTDEIKDFIIDSSNTNILSYGQKSNFSLQGNLFDRYLHYLNQIDSKYILFFIDDMFPLANVVNLDKYTDIMDTNDNIKIIKLSTYSRVFDKGHLVNINGIDFMQANNMLDEYIMNLQPIMIRKSFFIDLVNFCKQYNRLTHQNGGMEIYGTEYFRRNNHFICLRVIESVVTVNDSGGIVRSGRIFQDTQKMLKDTEGIEIETFDNNLIFKLTMDEFNAMGDRLKNEYIENNDTIYPS
jgi:hypothetical protein